MKPIEDSNFFSNIDVKDLMETQRQITLLINKISTSDSVNLKILENDLYHWTNEILYEKAKYLLNECDRYKQKINKVKTILNQ